jgi:hypothetical protein
MSRIVRLACLLLVTACPSRDPSSWQDLDGGGASEIDAAGASCACEPSSCGDLACGTSACGYPCGDCDGIAYCVGGACQPTDPTDYPCKDAFVPFWFGEGNVHQGDEGLRSCPGNPDEVEMCTCAGLGADSWTDCTGTCFTPCIGGESCGPLTCKPTEYCRVCGPEADGSPSPNQFACLARSEFPGCPEGSGSATELLCDGDEDCATGSQCVASVADWVTTSCLPRDIPTVCGRSGVLHNVCKTVADCPACATSCSPLPYADWTTPIGVGVKICE